MCTVCSVCYFVFALRRRREESKGGRERERERKGGRKRERDIDKLLGVARAIPSYPLTHGEGEREIETEGEREVESQRGETEERGK